MMDLASASNYLPNNVRIDIKHITTMLDVNRNSRAKNVEMFQMRGVVTINGFGSDASDEGSCFKR